MENGCANCGEAFICKNRNYHRFNINSNLPNSKITYISLLSSTFGSVLSCLSGKFICNPCKSLLIKIFNGDNAANTLEKRQSSPGSSPQQTKHVKLTTSRRKGYTVDAPANTKMMKLDLEQCKEIWIQADTVCFDVDSTLLKDEGLDELAEFCGVGPQVKEWTNKAMGGSVSFNNSLRQRLSIIKPTRQQVEAFQREHAVQFSDGVEELITMLHDRGTMVYLVSGGFKPLIEPAANKVGIRSENIFANEFWFTFDGAFVGHDNRQPTAHSMGKNKVAKKLKEETQSEKLVFIGDGVTDMEAWPPADLFIGYGGNVVRDAVKSGAPWFVSDFKELIDVLKTDQA